jgi:hypothetical protein
VARHLVTTAVLALALVGAGCGGDDNKSSGDAGGGPAAEAKVKENLKAIKAKDAQGFCDTLEDGYKVRFQTQIAKFTKDQSVKDCPGALNKAIKLAPTTGATFEAEPLAQLDIDGLDLKSSVVQKQDEWTATVKGPRGVASYDLVTVDGEWKIARAKSG